MLHEQYEVALVSLAYPHSWSNLRSPHKNWIHYRTLFHYNLLKRYTACRDKCGVDFLQGWRTIADVCYSINENAPADFKTRLEFTQNRLCLQSVINENLALPTFMKSYLGLTEAYANDTLNEQALEYSSDRADLEQLMINSADAHRLARETVVYYRKVTKEETNKRNYLTPGYYSDATALVDVLNDLAPSTFRGGFVYNALRRKIQLRLLLGECVEISSRLFIIMGGEQPTDVGGSTVLTHRQILPYQTAGLMDYKRVKVYTYTRSPDLDPSMNQLFVYCDIVQLSLVGNQMVPILSVVQITGKDGDDIRLEFSTPHYVPVFSSNFKSIEIRLCDDMGQLIQFDKGKALVKLHFRPKQRGLYSRRS